MSCSCEVRTLSKSSASKRLTGGATVTAEQVSCGQLETGDSSVDLFPAILCGRVGGGVGFYRGVVGRAGD